MNPWRVVAFLALVIVFSWIDHRLFHAAFDRPAELRGAVIEWLNDHPCGQPVPPLCNAEEENCA